MTFDHFSSNSYGFMRNGDAKCYWEGFRGNFQNCEISKLIIGKIIGSPTVQNFWSENSYREHLMNLGRNSKFHHVHCEDAASGVRAATRSTCIDLVVAEANRRKCKILGWWQARTTHRDRTRKTHEEPAVWNRTEARCIGMHKRVCRTITLVLLKKGSTGKRTLSSHRSERTWAGLRLG